MSAPRPKRVLFVAYYFPPRGGAGVQRSLKFVKYLREFGWEPTVLTTEYPRRSAAYDESLMAEVPEGTRVVKVPSSEGFFVRLGRKGLGRITGFLLRPDAMVTWAKKALPVAIELHSKKPFDLVYTSVQPWSMGLLGMWFKERTGVPWLCDWRDPWSQSLHLEWPTRWHWKADFRLEARYLDEADRSTVVTPTMREELRREHPSVPAEKIHVVNNGFDEDDFTVPPDADDGKFTVVFTGKFQHDWQPGQSAKSLRQRLRRALTYSHRDAIIETHSPIYFLRALARFLERFPERRPKVRVVFAGLTGAGNEKLAEELGLRDSVECVGYLPHAEAVALVKSAEALLLPMFSMPDGRERAAYAPGKQYEYMAARRPILGILPEGDARDIVERSGLGIVAGPRDVAGITEAIDELYRRWESGAPVEADEEYISRFTRKRLTEQMAGVFDEALFAREGHK